MNTYILDTSFIIAYLNSQDSNHSRVMHQAKTIVLSESSFYISDLIYAELLTVINRKHPGVLSDSLDQFMRTANVRFICNRLHEYLAFYNQFSTTLSVCDLSLIYDSHRLGADILSCDEQVHLFAKQYTQ